jgi:hypothetical protein
MFKLPPASPLSLRESLLTIGRDRIQAVGHIEVLDASIDRSTDVFRIMLSASHRLAAVIWVDDGRQAGIADFGFSDDRQRKISSGIAVSRSGGKQYRYSGGLASSES